MQNLEENKNEKTTGVTEATHHEREDQDEKIIDEDHEEHLPNEGKIKYCHMGVDVEIDPEETVQILFFLHSRN